MATTAKVMVAPPQSPSNLLQRKIRFRFFHENLVSMHWIHLNDEAQLEQILSKSRRQPQVIFKHRTRCSISAVAMQRLQRGAHPMDIDFYFVDLIAYRPLSN